MRHTPTSHRNGLPLPLSSICLTALLSGLFLTASSFAGSDVKEPDPKAATLEQLHPMYLGSLNTGIKGNDAYVDGNFSIVAPVWSTLGSDATLSGGMLFLEPYISWGEGGEVATSLGLGYRYLFGEQPISALTNHDGHQAGFFEEGISIGGSLFIDMLDTEANNQFWQLGVGLEVATRYVELSGNYYIPLSDKQLAEETRTKETFSTSTTSTRQSVSPLNSPYAQGNSIAQDATFTTYATTTTRTTTIERLFQRFEEGMEGWDAQIALLVPWVDRYMDVKVIGGYYSFDNQPFGPQKGGAGNVEGWKAGLEVRPVPALVLTGTWYEDERLTGGDWTLGFQMQIPFEAGELGDGKRFWGRIKDSFTPRRRHLIERLAEPVHRQNAAVKVANSFKSNAKSSSSVQSKTRVISSSATHLVLADDVVFVNNGDPVGGIQTGSVAGTGSAEQPVDTIQAGSTLAQSNSNTTGRVWSVYTQGTIAGYSGDVIAEDGSVKFIGSGSFLTGANGATFGSGPAPSLVGGVLARGIGTFGITGYTVIGGLFGGTGDGIRAVNVGTVDILSNTVINAGNEGIVVRTENGNVSNAVIANNSVFGAATNGIRLRTEATSILNATVSGNTVDSSGASGIRAHSLGSSSTLNLIASNNAVANSGEEGFFLLSDGHSTLDATLTNNTIEDVDCCGVHALSMDQSSLILKASDNTITAPGSDGFSLQSMNKSTLDATLTSNTITDAGFAGMYAASYDKSTLMVTATFNTIATPGLGLNLESQDQGNLIATFNNNSISGAAIAILATNGGNSGITLTANHNTIDAFAVSGLFLTTSLDSTITATFNDNTITGGDGGGATVISATGSDTSEITLTANNNTIDTSGGSSLLLNSALDSTITATFDGNTIIGGTYSAITAVSSDTSDIILMANNNTIDTPGDFGLTLSSTQTSTITATFTGNTLTGVGVNGIDAQSAKKSTIDLTVLNNTIEAVNFGINVGTSQNSGLNATINGNTINSVGIYAHSAGATSVLTLNADNNKITASETDAFTIESADASTLNANLTNNVITGVGGIFMRTVNKNSKLHAILEGNTITHGIDGGIIAEKLAPLSTLTVNGSSSSSNTVTGSGGLSLQSIGNPTGTFKLNGVDVILPVSLPFVPIVP